MRNIIVTGGSRGLGLGIARKLTAVGYHVIALARTRTDELSAASPCEWETLKRIGGSGSLA